MPRAPPRRRRRGVLVSAAETSRSPCRDRAADLWCVDARRSGRHRRRRDACIVDVDGEDGERLEQIRAELAERWELARRGSCKERAARVRPRAARSRRSSCSRRATPTATSRSTRAGASPGRPGREACDRRPRRQHARPGRRARARGRGRGHRRRRRTSPTWSGRPRPKSDPRARLAEPSRWGNRWLALGALLVGAAALRLVGVQYGLPFPLLNPDEESIVPRAWEMAHGGGLDPDWFDYPTLLMYALAPFQALGRRPVVPRGPARRRRARRSAGIAAAWWLGCARVRDDGRVRRRRGHRRRDDARRVLADGRHGRADDARRRGRARADGHAAGSSSPESRSGSPPASSTRASSCSCRSSSPAGASGAGSRSPLALAAARLRARRARSSSSTWPRRSDDARRVQRARAASGWLGFEDDSPTPIAFLDRLWEGDGARAPRRPARAGRSRWSGGRRADLILAAFVLAYFVDAAAPATRTSTATCSRSSRRSARSPGVCAALAPVTLAAARHPARLVDRRRRAS